MNIGAVLWHFVVPAIGAAVVTVVLYPPLIRALKMWKSGQVIQAELPQTHQAKAGTATGGGLLFIAAGLVAGALALVTGHPTALPPVAGLLAGGLIGFADDRA